MKIINRIVLLLLLLITSSCLTMKKQKGPEILVTPLSDTVILRSGSLIYALPMTVFTIKVEMERTIGLPGPYAGFAEGLLGLTDVITDEEDFWSVKRISVNSHEEVDPSEFYVIESNTLQQSNVLTLKRSGLILDMNPGSNPHGINYIDGNEVNLNEFRSFDLGSDEYYLSRTDTAYRRVKVNDQFIRIPYTVDKKTKLTTEQLAERAAKRLLELREGKFMILTGEANVFPQNEASIIELNRMEKDYTELFTGKVINQTLTFSYHFIPFREQLEKPVILFKFSELTGPGDADALNGIPVTIELIPEQKTKDIAIISKGSVEPDSPEYDRLYFRIPDVINLKIKMEDEILYDSRKLVYQLGQVIQLPANYIIGK